MDGINPSLAAAAAMLGAGATAGYSQWKGPPPKSKTGSPSFGSQEVTHSHWADFNKVDDRLRPKLDVVGDIQHFDTSNGELESTPGVQQVHTINDQRDYNFGALDIGDLYDKLEAVYPEIAAGTGNSEKYQETGYMYVREMETTTDLCNMSNQTAFVTLYDCVKCSSDRLNGAQGDGDEPSRQFYPAPPAPDFSDLWTNGLLEQATDYADPGLTPFTIPVTPDMSKRFTHDWQIRSTVKFELGPGELHRHTTKWAPNVLFQMSRLRRRDQMDGFDNIANYFKSLTHCTIIVFHGQVCCASGAGATYSSSKLCYIQTRRMQVQWAIGEVLAQSANLAQATTMGTTVMNMRTAAPTAYDEAN